LDEQASARGVEAWEIASSLREAYNIDRAEMIFDYHDALQKVLRTSLQEREKRAANQAEMLKELSANDTEPD
jgi:hypothetical protein